MYKHNLPKPFDPTPLFTNTYGGVCVFGPIQPSQPNYRYLLSNIIKGTPIFFWDS